MLLAPDIQPAIQRALDRINGVAGNARSFDRLHELLEQQPYRLAYWRVSSEEINYRRFFDINDLVGLRMENAEVFAATHCLIRKLLAHGDVTGLRVDHADGMFNPRQYLYGCSYFMLRRTAAERRRRGPLGPTGLRTRSGT